MHVLWGQGASLFSRRVPVAGQCGGESVVSRYGLVSQQSPQMALADQVSCSTSLGRPIADHPLPVAGAVGESGAESSVDLGDGA